MALVDGIKLLESLSKEEKESLSLFCQERTLRPGEILFNEGDEGSSMYLLKEGEIDIYKKNIGGDIHIGEVKAEEILGEMAVFGNNTKRMATAKAVSDCHLLVILSFSIKDLTKKYPKLLGKIKEIINLRLIENKALEEGIKN